MVVDSELCRVNNLADITKARTVLGWESEVKFEVLIKNMIQSDVYRITKKHD